MAKANKRRSRTKESVPSESEFLQRSIRFLAIRLGLIGDVITTVEVALQGQNAELDTRFAMTLRRCAADPVYAAQEEVEQLAVMLSERPR